MRIAHIKPNLDMHYRVDDYTDPWRNPEAALMMHGNHEGGAAWCGCRRSRAITRWCARFASFAGE